MTPEQAAAALAQSDPAGAAQVLEQLPPAQAAAIVDAMSPAQAAAILEAMPSSNAGAIMNEMSTAAVIQVISAMSEAALMERLPEMSAEKLYAIPPAVLFAALPNAPTEQLVGEVPPTPPPGLSAPVVYTTPTGTRYLAIATQAGEWVVIMGTPDPLTKMLVKTNKVLENVTSTVEVLGAKPADVLDLPAGQKVNAYLKVTIENAKPEDLDAGYAGFRLTKKWLADNNIKEWSVVLNRYDTNLKKWVALPTKKTGEDDTYVYFSSTTPGFSYLAVTGSTELPPVEFLVFSLKVSESQVAPGSPVTITADIKNISTTEDTYVATLWVNKTVEASQAITLAGGATAPVSFTVSKKDAGSYEVRLDRQTSTFKVLKPAEFKGSDLVVTPATVNTGDTVTISAKVTNVGELEGNYTATLKLDGATEATKEVKLAAGASSTVSFTVKKDKAGTYNVELAGLPGKYTVSEPTPWTLMVVGVVVGLIIIGVVVWLLLRRRPKPA
jgi:PGF-pre-PGF domain-containing protein